MFWARTSIFLRSVSFLSLLGILDPLELGVVRPEVVGAVEAAVVDEP